MGSDYGDLRGECGASREFRSVIVDGVRLAYDDSGGDRAPLFCLHAVGHGAGDSAAFRARHRDHFRMLALDWPGHGRSAVDHAPPSAARYAALVAGVLDALALPPAVVLGNSIGGAAAVRLAAARPDRVRALILANPGGFTRASIVKRAFTGALAWIFARGAAGARWFPRFWRALCSRVLATPAAAEQRDRIIAAGPELAPLLRDAWRSFADADDGLHAQLRSLACPVLVTWSLGDPVNPLFINRAAIRLIPDGRLRTFAGGHAPFLEVPDAFDAVFAQFIEELRP